MLIIKVATEDGHIITLYLEDDWKFSKLKELIKDQLNIPVKNQKIYLDGKLLDGEYDLMTDAGLKTGEVLLVKSDQPNFDLSALVPGQSEPIPDDLIRTRSREILEQFPPGSPHLEALRQHNLEMYKAILTRDVEEVFKIVRRDFIEQRKEQVEEARKILKAYMDPLNPESQKIIHKEIERSKIDQNLISAQNYLPESFGKIVMLYIRVEINNVTVKALVDTGAQNTIMSKECAAKCDLLSLVDERFKALAVGVGTARSVGRIHMVDVKIGNVFVPMSFIVIEQENVEFILGLDLIRRYTMEINLRQNYLGINDEIVPFLSEGEINNFVNYGPGEDFMGHSTGSFPNPLQPPSSTSGAQIIDTPLPTNTQMEEKIKRFSETFQIDPETAKELLELAEGDEQLAGTYMTE